MAFVADIVNDALPLGDQEIQQLSQLLCQHSIPPGFSPAGRQVERRRDVTSELGRVRSQCAGRRLADHHPPDPHPVPPGKGRPGQPTDEESTARGTVGLRSRLVAARLLRQRAAYRPVGAHVVGNPRRRRHESDHAGQHVCRRHGLGPAKRRIGGPRIGGWTGTDGGSSSCPRRWMSSRSISPWLTASGSASRARSRTPRKADIFNLEEVEGDHSARGEGPGPPAAPFPALDSNDDILMRDFLMDSMVQF